MHPAANVRKADDDAAIAEAARLIANGHPVAVPTETVYGLAADAGNADAVAKIYAAKGRPDFNPLIVHVPDLAAARMLAHFPDAAEMLADAFWPGALTMVLTKAAEAPIAPAVTAGLATIAIRCPAHDAMQALLRASGKPLAAPSANSSGRISPTEATHVATDLGERISLILDGGACARGIESTIIAIDGQGGWRLLRPGPIGPDEIAAIIGPMQENRQKSIEAPGQMASHYAPQKPVRLNVEQADDDEWLIGFGGVTGDENLSSAADTAEAAAQLYAALHRADASAKARIAVAPIYGALADAINDRLGRAAVR